MFCDVFVYKYSRVLRILKVGSDSRLWHMSNFDAGICQKGVITLLKDHCLSNCWKMTKRNRVRRNSLKLNIHVGSEYFNLCYVADCLHSVGKTLKVYYKAQGVFQSRVQSKSEGDWLARRMVSYICSTT